ncbi:MAG: T9SS type A sorting domain-containing protein [Bacteroidales bacterium]|nr:T9SS type A sorting domain-containing protein [Bacteroidales bacterium]
MKKSIFTFVLLSLFAFMTAQEYTILQSSMNKLSIEFNVPKMVTGTFKAGPDMYTSLTMDGYTSSTEVGSPALPLLTKLIEVPLCEDVNVNIVSADFEEYDAAELGIEHTIMPCQQSYPKSYQGERPFNKNEIIYHTNAFYIAQPEVVTSHLIGTMRDVNMANVVVSPVAYNPVTNRIRLYSRISVEITFENANIPATLEMKDKYYSPLFHAAKEAVINPFQVRDEFTVSPIKYLIIANSMFADNENLAAFIAWKKRIGYIVEVAYTSNIGTTTTAIKNYIAAEYTNATAENPAPTFVLFIGDVAQVPTFTGQSSSAHKTDLYYATWTSGDHLPDCYYGRFSAQNVSQLNPQFEKTLMYEQFTMPDPSYLGKAVLIAGTDNNWSPTHANGQINYVYNNYVNPNSTNHEYTTVYKHMYNCSSQAATIRAEVGAGCGWANYTAHGSSTGWADPSFSNSDVSSMSNADKYGFMIGNCCQTSKFDESECFAEAVVRAANKGAVGYVGGSNNTYWDEDFYWAVGVRSSVTANPNYLSNNLGAYDRIFHTHGESHGVWATTITGMMTAGNLGIEASSSDAKLYYWEIYHLMGDPSLKPYLGIPSTMTVSASDVLVIGSTQYDVQAAPYAYVALTHDNELVAAAFTDATGHATLNFNSITTPGTYELAVSAQNYIQYFQPVQVIAPSGPYVAISSAGLSQFSIPSPGSPIDIDIALTNYGVDAAYNVTTTITSNTPGVYITQGTVSDNSVGVDATVTHNNAFSAVLPADAKDGDIVSFTITTTSGSVTVTKTLNVTVLSPKLVITNTTIQNSNGSSSFAPGDMVNVTVEYMNTGHRNLTNATLHLISHYSPVTVVTPAQAIPELAIGATATAQYQVSIGASVPDMTIVPLYIKGVANNLLTIDTTYISLGNAVETFESGDLTAFSWQNNSYPWFITNVAPYAGTYCARSKQNLNNNTQSVLSVTVTSTTGGNISFFRKVSSEVSYDFFRFFIDGEEKDSQSGNISWSQFSTPVSAGTHTYKFMYEKDYSATSGSDCAWIDNVSFPGMGTMCVEDGSDNVGVESHNELKFNVFPNPTTGLLHIECSEPVQQIVIYDLSGRQVAQESAMGAQHTLNVNHLTSGVYFVRIITEDNTSSISKFIKQ